MPRYIDADWITQILAGWKDQLAKTYGDYDEYVLCLCDVLIKLDDTPSVDAVPVVRCKDCKHRDPEDKKCDCGHDIQWQLPRDAEWFCADGERVDDE